MQTKLIRLLLIKRLPAVEHNVNTIDLWLGKSHYLGSSYRAIFTLSKFSNWRNLSISKYDYIFVYLHDSPELWVPPVKCFVSNRRHFARAWVAPKPVDGSSAMVRTLSHLPKRRPNGSSSVRTCSEASLCCCGWGPSSASSPTPLRARLRRSPAMIT